MGVMSSELLIYLAAGLLLIGYAIRDELRLRVLITVSSFVYIAYYFAVGPLWGAIITSILMLAVNFWVLGQILLERTTFRLSDDEKSLFEAFETLTPGQFRKVLKAAKWRTASGVGGTHLTVEDEPLRGLFYVFEGVALIEKGGQRFGLPERNFVGEIGYVLERPASATAIAPPGLRYVEWNSNVLRALSDKHPALGNALNALLTRDLAKKLTASYRPSDAVAAPGEMLGTA